MEYMTRFRNKSLIVLLVAFVCIAVIGVTFAWAGFKASKETSLSVLKVSLDVTFDGMTDSMANVARGDTLVNSIKFKQNTGASDCYVRARLVFKSNNLANDDVKKFLLSVNYEGIDTTNISTSSWYKHTDGYYYLATTSNGTTTPTVYSASNTINATTFCGAVTYKGAVGLYGEISAPTDLVFRAEVQAVQSKNITDKSISNLSNIFTEAFGADPEYGHIVTFVTNNNSTIIAQTFFNNNGTVEKPADPYKLGYTFTGWYTDSNCSTIYSFSTKVTSSFTLYAGFVQDATRSGVTFGKATSDGGGVLY